MHDYSKFRALEKAPQIGFSWTCALEATWDCLLHLDATDGFVSVDQREASEKILYAKKAYSELPSFIHDWIPLTKDSTEELWFGDSARPSRVMSIPATSALRGRRMSVYLDEVDFYKDGGREAKRVALGRTTRGGRVTMGSTCFGIDTALDETIRQSGNFSKARLPHVVAENPEVIESIEIARSELHEDDFAEEYECVRGGSVAETFQAKLLNDRTNDHDNRIDLDTLEIAVPAVLGYDVASARHPAIASLLEQHGAAWEQIALMEIRNKSLPDQERTLHAVMKRNPNLTLVIDALGVGLQITQSLEAAFPERVIQMKAGSKPDDRAPQDRGEMVVEFKRALEAAEVTLLNDKEQKLQFRRTRLTKGSTGKMLVEQPGSKKRSHYDKFWATVYAWYGAKNTQRESVYESRGLLIIGGKSETTFRGHRRRVATA